jgi:serine protease Do
MCFFMQYISQFLSLLACGVLLCAPPVSAQTTPAEEPTVKAVRLAMPAVVNIATERVVRRRVRDPYDLFFEHYFGGRPGRLAKQKVQSLGSGFLIDSKGYIVTNQHVVERAADLKIQVMTSDGKTYRASYVAGDTASDLALIKIEDNGKFPFIDLNDLSPNHLGQTVLALGNPLGYGSSVSRGILSAMNRSVLVDDVEYQGLIQTDAAINPGNSGGPLIDLAGRLVGMNSVKMAFTPEGVPTQGIGFAIPAANVRERVEAMRSKVKRRKSGKQVAGVSVGEQRFGLRVQDLTEDLTDAFGYGDSRGVLIADIEQGGPADQAGLTRGLVIYRVGRYEVSSVEDIEQVLAKAKPGQVADFTVGVMRRVGRRYLWQIETVSITAR